MFVWHSKGTEESAVALAEKLGCEHGTVPPPGYAGEVFCYGAAPADNFNWGNRTFTKIINDPRKYRKYRSAQELLDKLGAASINVPVRLFCVGGEVVKMVGEGVPDTLGEGALNSVNALLVSLEHPETVTLDGFVSKDGSTFRLTKVVLGAGVTEHQDVLDAMVKVAGPTPEEDKAALQELIDAADPEELRALRGILGKLKAQAAE